MIESEADRLAMIQAVGERFDAGAPALLWGIFDREYLDVGLGRQSVSSARPVLQCRSSDVAAFELIKDKKLRRVADDAVFFVKDLEPDGTGMTTVVLKK